MAFNSIYEGKKVLLTGHTGFKGSWMALWLTQLGAKVFGYALEPASKDDNFVCCGLDRIIHHRIGDVRDAAALKAYFHEVQPDIAFHLAAQPLVLKSYEEPAPTFETNVMGTVHFFEAVRNTSSVQVAVNITSDKCYDNKEWVWGYRENDPMGGKDPYSASKGCAELITASYMHSFFDRSDCRVASARAGNVIGGGDWAINRIVPDFFRSIKNRTSLYLRNPYATRPWQHVLEPISGYLQLGAALFTSQEYCGGWNFGPSYSGNYSVKELVDAMIKYSKTGSIQLPEKEQALHEAHLLKLDISKAISLLKWQPVLDFQDTIEFTVDGYLDQLRNKELLRSRMQQIQLFVNKAVSKQISWAY